jgi:hypothetical protein
MLEQHFPPHHRTTARRALPLLAVLSLLLGGCSSMPDIGSVWPFGGDKTQPRSRVPANATEFQCNGGKRFYVRYLDNGAAAWVIFPDREFRLDRAAGDNATRYSSAAATLDVNGGEATLTGAAGSFEGCKVPAAKP